MALAINDEITAALNAAIQPKLAEVGWSTGGADDSALAEYIILMLANGKTQEQIAAELSGDLLNLGPDDPGATEFSRWLFEVAEGLVRQQNGGAQPAQNGVAEQQQQQNSEGGDHAMGDAMETSDIPNAPTGPKSMRTGNGLNAMNRGRDKRMLGQMQRTLDNRGGVLNRVRNHTGAERISRPTPAGPRGNMQQPRGGRFGPMNGMQGPPGAPVITPAQQMEMFQMMQQMFSPEQQAAFAMGGGPQMGRGMQPQFGQQRGNGRSVFDRQQRQQNFNQRQQGNGQNFKGQNQAAAAPQVSPLDMELTPAREPASPDNVCKYNLHCTNPECKFAHQSPAAPPGTTVDVTDTCAFGAACMNRKCTGRHPSPAQKKAHNAEQDCKFFPNCTNKRCPFRHPSAPLCRNGADCKDEGCTFTHVQTKCKFNPCLNPACAFKHEEGQKRGKFEDKVWVNPAAQHVSERKFVDESAGEELILTQ